MDSKVFSCITFNFNGQHCRLDDHDKEMIMKVIQVELDRTVIPAIEKELQERYLNRKIELEFDKESYNADVRYLNTDND